jgi:membrane-associated phospholipid phosphatase
MVRVKETHDLRRAVPPFSIATLVSGALFILLAFVVVAQPALVQPLDDFVGQLIDRFEGPSAAIVDASTYLGDRLLIWPITLGAVLLTARRCRSLATLLAVSAVSALVIEVAVKFLVDRPRPGAVGFLASFPSGHVMAAVAWWGLVPAVTYVFTRSHRLRRAMLVASTLIVLAVAMSRVSLGAHWASDTIAGVLLGVMVTGSAYWIAIHARSAGCDCALHRRGDILISTRDEAALV